MTNVPLRGAQAVARALTLLKSFSDSRPELGLSELARITGFNKSTSYRLLSALENEGLLSRNPDTDTYRLGPGVISLAGIALRSNPLRTITKPELKALSQKTQESASLEVLAGNKVMVLEDVRGSYVVSTNQFVGSLWPIHATATGKAILAHLDRTSCKQILHPALEKITPYTITSLEDLESEFITIRLLGYAVADQELEIGFSAVAAPILNHDAEAIGSISIEGPKARLTPKRIEEIADWVKTSAVKISVSLGYTLET